VRAHDVAGARDEQLGRRADEPVDGEHVRRRVGRAQSSQHLDGIDGLIGLDDDLAREHDLLQLAALHGVDRRRDRGAPC
jgi:hypothetical protein